MTFYPNERIALFVDAANLYAATKALGFSIDWSKLLGEFRKRGRLLRARYYTAIVENEEYSPLRPLIDWLAYNGFSVETKRAKQYVDQEGRRRIKGDMDIEIAVDMLEATSYIDHMVLFSGDGDFRRLVDAVQRRGVRVTVVSTTRSNPPMVSDDLRRQADTFIDLADLISLVGRAQRDEGYDDDEYEGQSQYEDEDEDE
jgi:uncharacterized LabA/DUF88 family protein